MLVRCGYSYWWVFCWSSVSLEKQAKGRNETDSAIFLAYILHIENAIKTRSCVRFWLILHVKTSNIFTTWQNFIWISILGSFFRVTSKTIFSKNAQNQRAKLIFFKKKAKILLFNFGLFQQVLLTWNDYLAKEARRLKSKIEFEDWCRKLTRVGLLGAVQVILSKTSHLVV